MRVLIDTNVLISAALSANGVPLEHVSSQSVLSFLPFVEL